MRKCQQECSRHLFFLFFFSFLAVKGSRLTCLCRLFHGHACFVAACQGSHLNDAMFAYRWKLVPGLLKWSLCEVVLQRRRLLSHITVRQV